MREGVATYLRQLLVVERHQLGVDGDLSGGQSGSSNEVKTGVSAYHNKYESEHMRQSDLPNELAPEPEERFLEVVI